MMERKDELFASLGFIQYRIQLGEPERNLRQIAAALGSVEGLDRSLVVLPELWSSGFAYGRFEAMADQTPTMLAELAILAGRYNCIFAGSLPERTAADQGDLFYNTLYVSGAAGVLGRYRKQQVFAFGGEDQAFICGIEPYPVATPLGRLGCLVCYDLRFPELARWQCQQGADLLLCSAEWPQAVVVPAKWRRRDDYRSHFSSFAVAAYPFRDVSKILPSAASCLDLLSLRKRVGQRLVCCEVGRPVNTAMLQALEEARRQGDFLLVAVSAGAQGEPNQRLLAALGCVDAVCRLDAFTGAERGRLLDLIVETKVLR